MLYLAALSWGAAMIHGVIVVPHFREDVVLGALFATLATLQSAWGVVMYRLPTRAWLRGGVLLNVGVLLVWFISRTIGLGGDVPGGGPEPVGFADVGAGIAELTLVVGLTLTLRRPQRARQVPSWARRLAVVTLVFAGFALLTASDHNHPPSSAEHAH